MTETKTYNAVWQLVPDGVLTVLSTHKTEDAAAKAAQVFTNKNPGKVCAWVEAVTKEITGAASVRVD